MIDLGTLVVAQDAVERYKGVVARAEIEMQRLERETKETVLMSNSDPNKLRRCDEIEMQTELVKRILQPT